MQKYKMWIGGKWVNAVSGETYHVINPATEEIIAEVPLGNKDDVNKAVIAARKAFPVWSQKSQEQRNKIISQMAFLMREHIDDLAALDVLDHGTPIKLARMQVDIAAANLDYAAQASRAVMGSALPVNSNSASYIQREPIGIAALIIPWNGPIMMVASKMGACLAAGNTCVIKPSAIDSLETLEYAKILSILDVPMGTINVVTGPGGSVGEAMACHPDINFISFTGSSETGKAIMKAVGKTLKRLHMELGGKNPFIVLEDADIEKTAVRAAASTCHNTGMVCAAPGRFYVHEKIHDEFVDRYIRAIKKIVVGDPDDETTDMGPVVSAEHRDRVESYIKSGIEEGARLLLGGRRPTKPPFNKGYYVMPAVFTGVKPHMKIFREEIFGPVGCFIKFSTDEEVIRSANDNVYGLCGSVWTGDTARGLRIVNQIKAGCVGVNTSSFIAPESPWGGFKESGFGKENSIYGLEEYTQLKYTTVSFQD
jgi:betaine-aldehyde dehydrogenase